MTVEAPKAAIAAIAADAIAHSAKGTSVAAARPAGLVAKAAKIEGRGFAKARGLQLQTSQIGRQTQPLAALRPQ